MNRKRAILGALLLFSTGLIAGIGATLNARKAGLFAQKKTVTRIAAASDLKFAMDEILALYKNHNPGDVIEVTYGSSGNFATQIEQGAPFDIFFSADKIYPEALKLKELTGSEVVPYAIGRIVLWSPTLEASRMTLKDLTSTSITRIAIANPKHAPYGQRAEEALRATGVWDQVESKLVYGENIAQTAQYVQSGTVPIGIIALSLILSPDLSSRGSYFVIPESLHKPLEQAYVLTKRAEQNPVALRFSLYMKGPEARAIMNGYGFVLP